MAAFTKYTSADVGAPQLSATAGELITVLNFALVTGQSWTHPVATAGNCASYKPPSGTQKILHLNNNQPHATALGKEGRITGWGTLSAVGGVGVGTGQFPTPAQLLTTGFCGIRISHTNDAVIRPWIIYADGYCFYMFIGCGGTSTWLSWGFGDFYSYYTGTTDVGRCMIAGRSSENTDTTSPATGGLIKQGKPAHTSSLGTFAFDVAGGGTGSQQLWFQGDDAQTRTVQTTSVVALDSGAPGPNNADHIIYSSPYQVQTSDYGIRGKLRGLYHVCGGVHTNGGKLVGVGDLSGKTFDILTSIDAGSSIAIETSATLPTNA